MGVLPHHQRASFNTCRFCLFSRRWGADTAGVVWVCVRALNGELREAAACGGTAHFVVRPGREEDFANRLERAAEP
jgi:hypothetical protein